MHPRPPIVRGSEFECSSDSGRVAVGKARKSARNEASGAEREIRPARPTEKRWRIVESHHRVRRGKGGKAEGKTGN